MNLSIRKACQEDATGISAIITNAIRQTNAKDYPADFIERLTENFSPGRVAERLLTRETYVALKGDMLIGTASLDGKTIRSVFILPEHQGAGVGLALMQHLEQLAAQSGVVELAVPSSITAEGFYLKLGYLNVREEHEGAEKILIMRKTLCPAKD